VKVLGRKLNYNQFKRQATKEFYPDNITRAHFAEQKGVNK
jgi:hypothetical protein